MKEQIGVIIMGVGVYNDKATLCHNRFLLETPKEFNEKIQELFAEYFPKSSDWKKFIVKETDYNYKEIK
jgi:hypothetical protein